MLIAMIDESPKIPDRAERVLLLDVLARAFRDNPMNIRIHGPKPGRRVRANRAGLRSLVLDSDRHTITLVIRREEQVVGGLVAAAPGAFPIPAPSWRDQIGCFLHQGARAMDAWGQVNAEMTAFRPDFGYWYLAVLGVEPELQGQGLGGRLLTALLREIRQSPGPLYLESDRPESVAFYLGHGFEIRTETSIHGVSCWCLGLGFGAEEPDLCDSVREEVR